MHMLLVAVAGIQGGAIADLPAANRLAERIVSLMNQGDALSLNKMALPEFFEKVPRAQFPLLVAQLHGMGRLSQPALLSDLVEQRRYRITISKEGSPDRQIVMVLGAESESKFFGLGMLPYRAPKPPDPDPKAKTLLDRQVQQRPGVGDGGGGCVNLVRHASFHPLTRSPLHPLALSG